MLRQGKGATHFRTKVQNSVTILANRVTLCVFATKQRIRSENKQKNTNDDDDYAFVMCNEPHSNSMWKWIVDSGASKHISSHKAVFDMYKVITPHNVHLDDNNIVQAIEMESIVVEALLKGKINQIRIKMYPNCMPICFQWANLCRTV